MKALEIGRKIFFIVYLGSFSMAGFAQIKIPVANDVYDIVFNADGSKLACTNENNILLWDMGKMDISKVLESGHTDKVLCVDYSPDDLEIASGGRDSMLILWDIAGNQTQRKYRLKTNGIITAMAYSPQYPILAFGNTTNDIYLYNYQENRIMDTLSGHQDDVLSLTFLDEKTLFSSAADGIIIKWDLEKNEGYKHNTKSGFIYDIDLNTKGNMLLAASEKGGLCLYRFNKNGALKKDSKNLFSFVRYSSVDFGEGASFYAYTSLKGKIQVITPYMNSSYQTEHPASKIRIQPRNDERTILALATLGGGVIIIDGKNLEYK